MLPLRYTVRNVTVRLGSTLLTMLGIALTVAVFAGILALRDGFASVYRERGSEDVAIYLRPGATSEGESALRRSEVDTLLKERPEIARDEDGVPKAAVETFLAVYLEKRGSGLTNVPLRGIQPMSLEILGDDWRVVEGRMLRFGTDEVVVGRPLTERMEDTDVGDVITLNTTPFRVVGVFECAGPQGGEVWGDVDRMMEALDRPFYQRVVAELTPGTDIEAVKEELESGKKVTAKVQTEREYLSQQTGILGGILAFLATFLTVVMGASAVLGAMNTMLAAVAARTHEVGVLLAIGYGRGSILLAFLLESALIGVLGGALGVLITLPFDGLQTGMMNFQTFTDVSLAFSVTPRLVGLSFGLAFVLGLAGGALPAARAARLQPVEALRTQ